MVTGIILGDQRAIVQRFSAYKAHIVGSMHGGESALATRRPEREDADEQMAELAADDDQEATTAVSSDCDRESEQEDVSMPCSVAKSQLRDTTFTTSSVCYVSIKRPKLLLRLDYPDEEACGNLRGIGCLHATIDAFGRVLHYYTYKFWCNGAGPATGLITTAFQQELGTR